MNQDLISRQAAIDAINKAFERVFAWDGTSPLGDKVLENVPSAQPDPMSEAYTKAVFTWLLEYQIKAAELKGRYTPYEVLSWVVNDWRKEHEGSD